MKLIIDMKNKIRKKGFAFSFLNFHRVWWLWGFSTSSTSCLNLLNDVGVYMMGSYLDFVPFANIHVFYLEFLNWKNSDILFLNIFVLLLRMALFGFSCDYGRIGRNVFFVLALVQESIHWHDWVVFLRWLNEMFTSSRVIANKGSHFSS